MTSEPDLYRFKMVLLGTEAVGKTSLVDRFINNKFEDNYISTLGYNVYQKEITQDNALITLLIFDIGGQERFRELRKKYATGANIAFLVYDITNYESFRNILTWKADLDEFAGTIPFIIIGNKLDLTDQRQVAIDEAKLVAANLGALDCLETSAKTGLGVENAFTQLAIKAYQLING